jgi:hypothetical protein
MVIEERGREVDGWNPGWNDRERVEERQCIEKNGDWVLEDGNDVNKLIHT